MFVMIFLLALLNCQPSDEMLDVKKYKWKHRVVCVSAENKEILSPFLHDLKNNKAGVEERKLIVLFEINGAFYKGVNMQSVGQVKNFPSSSEAFSFQLIGLDGGIKNVWSEQVSLQTIFNTIDAMPMRINERNNHR